MNPMTNMKNVLKLSEQELSGGGKSSWHDQYRDSAWVFVGGLPYDLSEGDVICVFSQYGEIVNINLVRDKATGKSRGFAFICYEDQRSTILAVDNLNVMKILNRTVRVDHCQAYKAPNADMSKVDELTAAVRNEGCAPGAMLPGSQGSGPGAMAISQPPLPPPHPNVKQETSTEPEVKHKERKRKKEKKRKKKKRKRSKSSSSQSSSD